MTSVTDFINKPGGYYVGTMTTTHKDGSQHVTQNDNTGRVYNESDYYAGGRVLKYSKTMSKDGTVFEDSWYPNGTKQSGKIVQADGSYKSQSYAADGHRTAEENYDSKTRKVSTATYNQVGQVTGTGGYTKVQKLGVKPTQGAQQQGLTTSKQQIKADVAKQIGDKSHVDVAGSKEKLKAGIADRLKNRGRSVQLNPQPLPPGPPPDKVGGNKHLDNKINIGSSKSNTKEGFARGEIPPGSKINGKVVPPSQTPGQVLQDSKHRPKINAMGQLKSNAKVQNWGSAAGSQGAAKHHPMEKLRQ
jgi:hypothetical protein